MGKGMFEACGGVFALPLVDPFRGIGFGLLDGARRPKQALAALTRAFEPTRVIIEPLGFESDRPFGILQKPDVPFAARLVIVNDDPEVSGRGSIRWSLARERAARRKGMQRLREAGQRKPYAGAVDFEVPTAFEPAGGARAFSHPLPA